jgi:hypothetical protein
MRPIRHQASARNQRKALHLAKNAHEELEYIERKLRRLLDEHVRYARRRMTRLINRLRAE